MKEIPSLDVKIWKESYIPNSVTEFDSEIFTDCDKLTIYCHKGSAAEKYAKENNIPVSYAQENELLCIFIGRVVLWHHIRKK